MTFERLRVISVWGLGSILCEGQKSFTSGLRVFRRGSPGDLGRGASSGARSFGVNLHEFKSEASRPSVTHMSSHVTRIM